MDLKNATHFQAEIKKHPEWELEKTIDSSEFSEWLSENFSICLFCSVLYVAAVFTGKKYMEDKERYNLRQPMMIWSLLLAVFSIFGAIRSAIVMYYLYADGGMHSVICSKEFYKGPIVRFWGPVFVSSKILEYMDTMFIILRKQKLIFLHWYHHMTVSLFAWWTYGAQFAGGGVFMTVNYAVHAMMYSYYAVRAANIRVPRWIAVVITASQIIQMIIGCWTVYAVNIWRGDGSCRSSWEHIFYGGIMYSSYFVLFLHFFNSAYLNKPRRGKPEARTDASKATKENGDGVSSNATTPLNGQEGLRERIKQK
uniref:Elongation of very long chain fatty acids protein n=1 Tax=Phallusia mammillata TaxID=59560 RepID=A0A6F9DB69_9ASCI|nr:elongation of very long chain fatty acids protein 6 [Phallusia mammillata]